MDLTRNLLGFRHPLRATWHLARMVAVARQRRALIALDDRALDDIGRSPDEARAEASRPIWDVPPTWLR